jgi:hypothetical protein
VSECDGEKKTVVKELAKKRFVGVAAFSSKKRLSMLLTVVERHTSTPWCAFLFFLFSLGRFFTSVLHHHQTKVNIKLNISPL